MNRNDESETQLEFILASASPRRKELLTDLKVSFEVVPSNIPEHPIDGEGAEEFAVRMALEKASEVALRRRGAWVLGADTIVVLPGNPDRILGKPDSAREACEMLAALSDREHWVMTGMALVRAGGGGANAERSLWIENSRVVFRKLSRPEIESYVETGEPMDKAGGYAIQGGAKDFVLTCEGSYSNVVGLPLESLRPRLEAIGLLPFESG